MSHLIPAKKHQYGSFCYFIHKIFLKTLQQIVNYDDASTSGESSICIAAWDLYFESDRKPGNIAANVSGLHGYMILYTVLILQYMVSCIHN